MPKLSAPSTSQQPFGIYIKVNTMNLKTTLTGALLLCLLLPSCREAPVINLVLEDADHGLAVGDAVIYKGSTIGKVQRIALQPRPSGFGQDTVAKLAIDAEYLVHCYSEMFFIPHCDGDEECVVDVLDHPQLDLPTPLVPGSTLDARSRFDYTLAVASAKANGVLDQTGNVLTDLVDKRVNAVRKLYDALMASDDSTHKHNAE